MQAECVTKDSGMYGLRCKQCKTRFKVDDVILCFEHHAVVGFYEWCGWHVECLRPNVELAVALQIKQGKESIIEEAEEEVERRAKEHVAAFIERVKKERALH